jgi:hypothetical protein
MIVTNPLIRRAQPGLHTFGEVSVDRERHPVTELLGALHLFHPNILLVDCGEDTEQAFTDIRPTLLIPLAVWWPLETPHFPAIECGSLIVHEIECLTVPQQLSLASLISRPRGTLQIVSIARLPLYPLVHQGLFLEDLYYRLNVVLLEAGHDKSYGW